MTREKKYRVHWRLKMKKTKDGFPVVRKSHWMTKDKAIRCYEKCVSVGYEARIGEFINDGIIPIEFISHTDNWTLYQRDTNGKLIAKVNTGR